MTRPRVAMLVANEVVHDGRVRKVARTVSTAGYDVTVVGIARREYEPCRRTVDGFGLWRVERVSPLRPAQDALVSSRDAAHMARQRLEATKARARRRTGLGAVWGRLRPDACKRQRRLRKREHALAAGEYKLAKAFVSLRKAELEHAKATVDDPFAGTWAAALDELQPGIVHVHDYHPLPDALAYVERRREDGETVRLVYGAHEYLAGREAAKEKGNQRILEIERAIAPRADAVITVSEPIADLLQTELGLAERPAVVYNLPSVRASRRSSRRLRREVMLPGDVPLVVYSGAVSERRGVDVLVRAVARLPAVHLVLVTTPEARYLTELLLLADELGADGRVHTAPLVPVEEVVSYLAGADAGVYTPRDDGVNHVALPNKIFEYLHSGLPLVVSDLGEIGRLVREHGIGETHRPGDDEACAAAIALTLENPGRYLEGRDRLIRDWSWEAQEPRLLDLYERLTRVSHSEPNGR